MDDDYTVIHLVRESDELFLGYPRVETETVCCGLPWRPLVAAGDLVTPVRLGGENCQGYTWVLGVKARRGWEWRKDNQRYEHQIGCWICRARVPGWFINWHTAREGKRK